MPKRSSTDLTVPSSPLPKLKLIDYLIPLPAKPPDVISVVRRPKRNIFIWKKMHIINVPSESLRTDGDSRWANMKKFYIITIILSMIALLGFGAIGSLAAAPSNCPAGTTLCSGDCTSLSVDELHCGSCGNICPLGMACLNGTCTCLPGQALCNGKCIDMTIDPGNCGSCGKGCSEGMYCINGNCSCPVGFTLCQGACVDASIDDRNCGSCGNSCPSGTSCLDGRCVIVPRDYYLERGYGIMRY